MYIDNHTAMTIIAIDTNKRKRAEHYRLRLRMLIDTIQGGRR